MARLTATQRNKLPPSAFVYHDGPRSNWKYPVPTQRQAQKAGIGETQRQTMHAAAKSYSGRKSTAGSPRTVSRTVAKRK